MKKSHIWTLAMAFAALMNTPSAIDEDEIESLMSETKIIEGKIGLSPYLPEMDSEIRGLDSERV